MKNLLFNKYPFAENFNDIPENLSRIIQNAANHHNINYLTKIFNLIDLTILNTDDNDSIIKSICEKLNAFKISFPDIPEVAGFCIYPSFIHTAKESLTTPNVKIVSVAAGFPTANTFAKIKKFECSLACEMGADEIDIVFPVGKFFESQYQQIFFEIQEIKKEIQNKKLKVILETGLFKNINDIRLASIISMEAGADFIKTSTGKLQPAATPEAVYIMAKAILEFYTKTGVKKGIKPAGGISSVKDSLVYFAIVKEILGDDWITPELFRIGASKLANNLLYKIISTKKLKTPEITYF